jgi:hypothetical protein
LIYDRFGRNHTLVIAQLENVDLHTKNIVTSLEYFGGVLCSFCVPDAFYALLLLSFKLCTVMIVMRMDFQCNFTVAMQTGFVSYWMFHVSCLGFVIDHWITVLLEIMSVKQTI